MSQSDIDQRCQPSIGDYLDMTEPSPRQAKRRKLAASDDETSPSPLPSPAGARSKSTPPSSIETITKNHAQDTRDLVKDILDELDDPAQDATLQACGRAPLQIIESRPQDVLDLAHTQIHAYPYHAVPVHWRRLYEEASVYLAVKTLREGDLSREDIFAKVVGLLDYALIVSGAPKRKELIEAIFARMQDLLPQTDTDEQDKRRLQAGPPPRPLSTHYPICRASNTMDITEFQTHLDTATAPIIIPGVSTHWPASSQWDRVSYLLYATLSGSRLVPVELGRSYTDESWSQRIISFKSFVDTYLLDSSSSDSASAKQVVGYLAQHDLFTQIPSLRNDILLPDYVYASPPAPSGAALLTAGLDEVQTRSDDGTVLMNAWLGPKGTRTPLHTDPYHNVLCQVVGYKYVRLYPPEERSKLYPRDTDENGVSMANTSSVDVSCFVPEFEFGDQNEEKNDTRNNGIESDAAEAKSKADAAGEIDEEYPLFREARYQEAILGPGEALYLPLGWWHYLESVTPSFSVSFWFG